MRATGSNALLTLSSSEDSRGSCGGFTALNGTRSVAAAIPPTASPAIATGASPLCRAALDGEERVTEVV